VEEDVLLSVRTRQLARGLRTALGGFLSGGSSRRKITLRSETISLIVSGITLVVVLYQVYRGNQRREFEGPSEERLYREPHFEVPPRVDATFSPSETASSPRSWWQEMLRTTLPTVIGPVITAVGSGVVTILATIRGATLLAIGSFGIAVIGALFAIYFGVRLQFERRQRRLVQEAASAAGDKILEAARVATDRQAEGARRMAEASGSDDKPPL
jgi:hypothetical protein